MFLGNNLKKRDVPVVIGGYTIGILIGIAVYIYKKQRAVTSGVRGSIDVTYQYFTRLSVDLVVSHRCWKRLTVGSPDAVDPVWSTSWASNL
jgi:hypothetical protein